MSPLDYEIFNGALCIGAIIAIYYFWFKFELKASFKKSHGIVTEKLQAAHQACASEDRFSKSSKLLREADIWMKSINEYCLEVDVNANLNDLIAVRQQLCFVERNIDLAMSLSSKPAQTSIIAARTSVLAA